MAQPRTGTPRFLLVPELLNLRKHKICLSLHHFPLDLQLLFYTVISRSPRALWGRRDYPAPTPNFAAHAQQQRHLVLPDKATNTSAAWTPRDQGSQSPSPQQQVTTPAGPRSHGCPVHGSLPSSCLQPLCPSQDLRKPSLAMLAQHTPSLEKHRPIPSSPKISHAQTFPFHSSTLKFNFLHLRIIVNCLSQSLSLGLIQPFGLGLFLIARTISVWARNPPFNPPTLFPFQIPGNINSCFSMAPKQATWAGSVLPNW